MNKRNMLKNELIIKNGGMKYLNESCKNEYLKRLKLEYKKEGKVKSFFNQFNNGDGSELKSKFFNVYSSSRLCFDLFSWMAKDNSILDIEFEYHLPPLYSNRGNVKPPNMDVFYKTKDKIVFIESKFTEYIKNRLIDIPEAYYKELGLAHSTKGNLLDTTLLERYGGNKELEKWFPIIISMITHFIMEEGIDNMYDWFDLKQEITHIYGISQWIYMNLNNINENQNIYFYNVYYDFRDGVSSIARKYQVYVNMIMVEYLKSFGLNNRFYYKYITSQEFAKTIQDEETKIMLKERYNIGE